MVGTHPKYQLPEFNLYDGHIQFHIAGYFYRLNTQVAKLCSVSWFSGIRFFCTLQKLKMNGDIATG
jgi:hypothetical protein